MAARVGVFYPLLWLASAYCTWALARMTLGRPPRPLFDDPNGLNGVVRVVYVPSGTMMGCAPFALLAGVVAVVMLGPARRPAHPRAFTWALQLTWSWLLTISLLLLDPGRVFAWYID